jgi:hypothetical protein
MSKRISRQTPLDLLIEKQGSIKNLFNFLKENNTSYSNYYYKKNIIIGELNNNTTKYFKNNSITVASYDNGIKGDFNNDFNISFSITSS